MIFIPAIDIIDGKPVRLQKGDYNTSHMVAESVMDVAKRFEQDGARYIHIVDLDGAKEKRPVNFELIAKVISEVSVPVEVGGGIRDMSALKLYIEAGAARIILGSSAIKDRAFLQEAVENFGEKIAVGIDAENGIVKINGWCESSDTNYIDFAKELDEIGVKTFIVTDISKDGMMEGPGFYMLDKINKAVSADIVASGGVTSLEDIKELEKLGLYGAICGKSIYSGKISVKEANGIL